MPLWKSSLRNLTYRAWQRAIELLCLTLSSLSYLMIWDFCTDRHLHAETEDAASINTIRLGVNFSTSMLNYLFGDVET